MQPAEFRVTSLSDLAKAGFDTIIDSRSPSEYAEDHLPGAINLPVLDDAQRAEVGTIYKQVSPFQARKIGGAIAAANVARHVAGPLARHDGGWRPLVYCWRGGQRSGAFSTILAQIGWRTSRLEGGWKSWRALVLRQVQDLGPPSPLVVLDGNTGSAKTEILHRLAARGVQIIDLEGLANHRGSLFGAMPGGQPAQKLFESRLAMVLAGLDPARPAVIARELTKLFETVLDGTLADLLAQVEADDNQRKGEFVVMVQGAGDDEQAQLAHGRRVYAKLSEHLPPSTAAKLAAELTGAPRKALYGS